MLSVSGLINLFKRDRSFAYWVSAFDGTSVSDTGDVLALLNNSDRVGKTVSVQIVRGAALIELAIAIDEKPIQ